MADLFAGFKYDLETVCALNLDEKKQRKPSSKST